MFNIIIYSLIFFLFSPFLGIKLAWISIMIKGVGHKKLERIPLLPDHPLNMFTPSNCEMIQKHLTAKLYLTFLILKSFNDYGF